jgi:2,4-dienoyl-CoA reductase-like NADH-dependent reductase (Old Yellow Enzyme family)
VLPVTNELEPLFTSFHGGGLSAANRFVMAPMTRWHSPGECPGREVAAYYRRRAEAGVGLIITEGTTVDHPVASYSARVPAFHGRALDGWRRVVEEVHDAGAKIVPQLWHVGAMRNPKQDLPNSDRPPISPSGMYKPGSFAGQEMSTEDVEAVVDAFARAAHAARQLGFDGVEIHGAHGYLLDQFLWGRLNLRKDEYGGGPVERTRFAVAVVSAVRREVGADFPLILRISQWKQQDYAARLAETPDALQAILCPIVQAGVSIFHCSQRRYWESEFEGSDFNFAAWVKKLTGLPTITVGSVGLSAPLSIRDIGEEASVNHDLTLLAEAVTRGEYDLVAVGRALLADPDWVHKVREKRFDELRSFDQRVLDTLW